MASNFDKKLEEFFNAADVDKSKVVTQLELCKILQKMGFQGSVDEIMTMFADCDTDRDGGLTLAELKKVMSKKSPSEIKESELRACFKEFDKDGSGFITKDELQIVINRQGYKGHAEKYIEKCDSNKDGKINVEEFIALFRKEIK